MNRDPNITVGGKPIDVYLEGEKKIEVQNDIKELIQDSISLPIYKGGRVKGQVDLIDHKDRNERTKHLSPAQIRKEYGIMTRPFKTAVENILWYILNKGPVTTTDLALGLEMSVQKVSNIISRLKLSHPYLLDKQPHETQPNKSIYKISPSYSTRSVESLYELYKKKIVSDKPIQPIQEKLIVEVSGKIEVTFRWA